jgi:hypothetical protein
MSVRPSTRMIQLGSHWTDFHEILYYEILSAFPRQQCVCARASLLHYVHACLVTNPIYVCPSKRLPAATPIVEACLFCIEGMTWRCKVHTVLIKIQDNIVCTTVNSHCAVRSCSPSTAISALNEAFLHPHESLLIPTTTQCIVFATYLARPADPTGDQLSSTGRIYNPLKQRLLTCTAARPTWVLRTCSWTHTKTVEVDELFKRKMQRNYETDLTCILIL